ncbi:serine/threonine protein kinase [Plasmodium fragile]|uniref:Serine/threonine protein kinase n=1 Tax=Plasmodium fragile TaxID=5857 RepID=A0A0D9QID2_PLAFR|nr:serine/threonine protein kinase [Plasmodium fragile]KJP86820.1 serine/threonine protein kinase [Plasmodium fragile]
MESNGVVQDISEKKKKRKIPDMETPQFGSANVGVNSSANSSARVYTYPNTSAFNQYRNKKKIIKLKNRKIEDLFVIRNFLPICEEFLVKQHESIFSTLLPKQDEEKNKTKGKEELPQAITKREPGQDESELDRGSVQLEQTNDHNGGGIKVDASVSDSVDDLGDGPTADSEKGSSPNHSNLYKNYVQHTKQCLREMDLPFDRAVLLNIVDKKDNTNKIMKIVNKKKVISAFGDTWEYMIEHIISLKEHKNLMKIYDIYDDDKNFYMIMEKLHGKELFSFLVYKKQVKESVCKYILSQIFQAVNYLHHHNIIHRDIKPENLMFRNKKRKDKTYEYNYELVLIDFDTCQFVYPPTYDHVHGLYYSPASANMRRSVSPSSSTNGTPSACTKLCTHDEVKKMEQNKGSFLPGEMRKGCSKRFSERSTNGNSTQEQRSGTSNLSHHSGRQQPRTKSSSGKKHMKLVGTYGYIAPEIIKGHNYSILSDMWSIGIIFYILMTGITPLPMCLMVNYKNTKDIILKKEKKGINFSLLSFNSYPLARDLCEKLLQFDPAERMPNSVIASHHPWLRYFNMLGRNINLCASEREYLSHYHLNQNPLHDATYLKNKRPCYEDRNCHVILPYHMHQHVYQKKHLHPFVSHSNEQRYYYLINQGIKNYYVVGKGILPHPGLSTSLEKFPYGPGDNLNGGTLPVCDEKVLVTSSSMDNDFEGKSHPVIYYEEEDSKHTPRISHHFTNTHNDRDGKCNGDGGCIHPGEGTASVRHAQKMRRGEDDEEEVEVWGEVSREDDPREEDEKAESARTIRPVRTKTGKLLTNVKGKVNGADLHESKKYNNGRAHRYILTQQNLRSRDNNHLLTATLDPISVHPDDEPPPDCNNFVELFEHLIEKKKRNFTMKGKSFDQLPPIDNPFPMYYVANDKEVNETNGEIDRLFNRKEHTTTKEKSVEYIPTKNLSEIFSCPPMCIIPQKDPMRTIQIDQEYKRGYDFSPTKHLHIPHSHLALSHKGGRHKVIFLPQPLPRSLLPLVYHHSNELRNTIVLNDKGNQTNSSEEDIVEVITKDRNSSTCYANLPTNAYEPCQVTNVYETSNSLNETQEEQMTLHEGHKNGMHSDSQHDGLHVTLARTSTSSNRIPENGARNMSPTKNKAPPIYVNYRRAYKNKIEKMVPTMFREN